MEKTDHKDTRIKRITVVLDGKTPQFTAYVKDANGKVLILKSVGVPPKLPQAEN